MFKENSQKLFGLIAPDISEVIKDFEGKETWVYNYNELPRLFTDTAIFISSLVEKDKSVDVVDKIVQHLFPLLASMPFKDCIAAIVYLENNIENKEILSWGAIIYLETEKRKSGENEQSNNARIINERIKLVVKTKLAVELFTQINLKKK